MAEGKYIADQSEKVAAGPGREMRELIAFALLATAASHAATLVCAWLLLS